MVYGIMLALSTIALIVEVGIICFYKKNIQIYIFWHYRLIVFRAKAGLPQGEAINLMEIAKIHFTTHGNDNLALFRILEAKKKAALRRTSKLSLP